MVGKTRAKSNDLNPDYNEEFEFAFDDMRSMSSAALRFEVPLLPTQCHAMWDTMPGVIPCRVGYRDTMAAGRDTCRVG